MGDVLERVAKPVSPDPQQFYREIGIRSHGKGIFHKEPVMGRSLGDKRVFEVVPDCLALNIVFAWEQAVARTTTAEAGMIASHRFPMYRPRSALCDIDFVNYYFNSKRGKFFLELASPGGAGRNKTLGQKEFDEISFAMPPANEQAKIAEILVAWDKAILLTETLLNQARSKQRSLTKRLLEADRSKSVRLGSLFKSRRERGQTGLPRLSVTMNNGLVNRESLDRKTETTLSDSDHLTVRSGDIAYNMMRMWQGALGLADKDGLVSPAYVVLVPKPAIDSRYAVHLFKSPRMLHLLWAYSYGLTADRLRLYYADFAKVPVAIPSVDEQKRIAAILDVAATEIEVVSRRLNALRLEKAALMQKLLTGKCRVKPITVS